MPTDFVWRPEAIFLVYALCALKRTSVRRILPHSLLLLLLPLFLVLDFLTWPCWLGAHRSVLPHLSFSSISQQKTDMKMKKTQPQGGVRVTAKRPQTPAWVTLQWSPVTPVKGSYQFSLRISLNFSLLLFELVFSLHFPPSTCLRSFSKVLNFLLQ